MAIVEWFLRVHFSWRISSSTISVHMNQLGFASNLMESSLQDMKGNSTWATPYQSGIPVDSSIAPSTDAPTIPPHNSDELKLTKVSLAALDGLPQPLNLISLPYTPSCLPIALSRQLFT
jgi:hypothetical protein